MSYLLNNNIEVGDNSNITAFSRIRTSEAILVSETRYMYGSGSSTEQNDKLVGNGRLTSDHANNRFIAQVSTANGDIAIRQTKQYNSYIAGASNIGYISFVPNQPKTGVQQLFGMYDDYNGICLRLNELIPEFVIRSSFDYSTTKENAIPQNQWNLDQLDGSKSKYNPSGILIDFSKSQILVIDYQWLGLGRVRIGFSINGVLHYAHQFTHANIITETFIKQASLPCRYEIKNIANTASNSQISLICNAVYREGADKETGYSRTVSTGATAVSITTGTSPVCMLAVRLKNNLIGKPNRSRSKFQNVKVTTSQDIQYKVVILENSSYISSGAWSNVPGYGWSEYSTNLTLNPSWITSNNYSVIVDDFALGGAGNGTNVTSIPTIKEFDNRNLSIYQNYDSTDSQILAIIAYRLSADAAARATLNWLEEK